MPDKELVGLFPNLNLNSNTKTSCADINYNCVAWVFGHKSSWIEPFGIIVPPPPPVYIWPDDIPHNSSPQTYIDFFKKYGFELTDTSEYEGGIEKIAIYVYEDKFQHVAYQLPNGLWSSKLGVAEDIQHKLEDIECERPYGYGKASIFMRRQKN